MNDTPSPKHSDHEEAPKQVAESEAGSSLTQKATMFLLVVGGVGVAATLAPQAINGATRTARLVWQQRESEIAKVIESSSPAAPVSKP